MARPDHGRVLYPRREFGFSVMNGGGTWSELSFRQLTLALRRTVCLSEQDQT